MQAGPKYRHQGGQLTALARHPTKNVNKAEELTYLSTNIGLVFLAFLFGQPSFPGMVRPKQQVPVFLSLGEVAAHVGRKV